MKRHSTAGYTVLEVLIVFAVVGLLFAAIIPTYASRQAGIQFSQGVRDLDNKISDVINDTSTGYFPVGNFDCTVVGPNIVLAQGASSSQGTRKDCIFMGKVIGFNSNGSGIGNRLNVFTLVGKRLNTGDMPVTTLSEATPIAVARQAADPATDPDLTESFDTKWGIEVTKIVNLDNSQETGAVGILARLSGAQATGGTKSVDYAFIRSSSVASSNDDFVNEIYQESYGPVPHWPYVNPTKGLLLCLQNPGGGKQASILISGTSGASNTVVVFEKTNVEAAYGVGVCDP